VTEQRRRLRRNLIDLALAECEAANLAGRQRVEPWVLALAVELQEEQGCEVREPAGAVEALDALLDLQAAYLLSPLPDQPPAGAVAVLPGERDAEPAGCGGRAA
jgi:hypothetical protein